MKSDLVTSVFMRLKPRLLIKARNIVGDDAANDVLQDAFFRLWQRRASIRCESEAEGVSLAAVRNTGIDYLRRKAVRRENVTDDFVAIERPDDDDPTELTDQIDEVTRIVESQLSERQRSILYMRDRYGYSIEEIAAEYSLTQANVRMILSRSRNIVRECYRNYVQK